MGIFGTFFNDKNKKAKEDKNLPWTQLVALEQLDELESESAASPVVIFKHSTRCGISRMVLNRFEKEYDFSEGEIKLYFLDLLNYRRISQEIASRFGVVHESPQLILLQKGKPVQHTSHHGIEVGELRNWLN